jgi:hypothetical protein
VKKNSLGFSTPSTSLSIPITEVAASLLRLMLNTQMGSLELLLNEEVLGSPQLVISCHLSNVERIDTMEELKRMYITKQPENYSKLRQLVYQIIDDYYALEDEKLVEIYRERELEEELENEWEWEYEPNDFDEPF